MTDTVAVPERYDFWGSVRWVGPVAQWEARSVLWWATTTPDGPATVRLAHVDVGRVSLDSWGDGAAWARAQAPRLLGLDDDPAAFLPGPGLLQDLARRARGVHLARTDRVFEALVAGILGQKVQSDAARASLRLLARRHGEPAPGPLPRPMWLVPAPRVLARLDYTALHPCNVERARAERILGAARRAAWVEARGDAAELQLLPGIGPWTAAVAAAAAWGDPDAVPVGDFHLPNTVCWALAREPRGDDARMLELLEPYRGQRGRVVRLLTDAQVHAPRRGPRLSIMDNRRR
jgi:3-methyladenine DNA glycosylase/8-oxoguanine DNA glycosylase